MSWWNKVRRRGKHAIAPGRKQIVDSRMASANEDLQQTIIRDREIDRLVLRVRREFGVRS